MSVVLKLLAAVVAFLFYFASLCLSGASLKILLLVNWRIKWQKCPKLSLLN